MPRPDIDQVLKAYQKDARHPGNLILQHKEGCRVVGVRKVKCAVTGTRHGREQADGWGTKALGIVGYATDDGFEVIDDWACTSDCPVLRLETKLNNRYRQTLCIQRI
jgi:hypothetical protein